MDRSILPKGSDSKSLCPGWEGSATIFPARLGVLEGRQIAANRPLSRANDTLQSALVFGSSVPGGGGGGEDGGGDGSVRVHHRCLWRVGPL